ncbi:MAG: DUF4892 domain-containing protein [Acidobacteria bacterium]|nr:DUF4892 domain-containing protein [Acidobacteriota bacterium]
MPRILLSTMFGVWLAFGQPHADHPAISGYPGSRILSHKAVQFDVYRLTIGNQVKDSWESINLEGQIFRIQYRNPVGRSALEIFRNYEEALRRSGARLVYQCEPRTCAAWPLYKEQRLTNMGSGSFYGLAAQFNHRGAESWAVVAVSNSVTWIHVVERTPMQGGLVRVDAHAMAAAIYRDGFVSLDTIQFDTGKATIKPESKSALEQIALLLRNEASLALEVTGHTDDTGTLAGNQRLSLDRARSVIQSLATEFRIPLGRLQAKGAGQSEPVSSNATDTGRAANRRVVLRRIP